MIRNPSGVGSYDFANNPVDINIERSQFPLSFSCVQTMNAGLLVPYRPIEVLPGDSFRIRLRDVTRMATPTVPVMDDCYKDFYAFFVPRRLVWEHWQEFCGENKTGYWAQTTQYQIPHLCGGYTASGDIGKSIAEKSVLDYMGLPTKVEGLSIDACYPRAYALVWNEYFRDQNLMPAAAVPLGDQDAEFSDNPDAWLSAAYGGALLPVCKFHDYFTSALPGPQKALNAVSVPVSNINIENKPVSEQGLGFGFQPRFYSNPSGGSISGKHGLAVEGSVLRFASGTPTTDSTNVSVALMGTGGRITVNDMRTGFAIQRMYEKMARGGSRYRELLKSFFGVSNGDDRMQVPEYLGHIRTRINMQQVVQTSGSNISGSDTPQGNTAAYSLTGTDDMLVDRGFTEHGILLIVCCIRQRHTYQQGVPVMFSRRKFTDFYLPTFAHLGEQPILNKEIYCSGIDDGKGDETFGFKEAWSEYRYQANYVAGECRSNFPQSLDVWHYADDYDTLPKLSADWIAEDSSGIQRTLAVTSHDQFISSTFFEIAAARPMPINSIPGMIDHY